MQTKKLMDNERVRVTHWRLPPGAETGVHRHDLDYLVIPLVTGRLKIVEISGPELYAELETGIPQFRKGRHAHNVVNVNDFEFSFIETEIK